MNILDLELIRKKRIKDKTMIKIPIFKLVIEVSGEKEIPIVWLEKE
ncbi:hypothetical protein [Bacillus toyonensis]|nr:hypothetical protein [Bacillus toyonensis]